MDRIAQDFVHGRLPWPDAMRELLAYYRSVGATGEAARVAALLADAFPYRAEDQRLAAELLHRVGRDDDRVYRRRLPDQKAARTACRGTARRPGW